MGCRYDGLSLQNGRGTNMDSLLLKERTIGGRSVCIGVVCDGVGSLRDGAFAASTAVRLLSSWFDDLEETGAWACGCGTRCTMRTARWRSWPPCRGCGPLRPFRPWWIDQERYYIGAYRGTAGFTGCWDGELVLLTQDQEEGGKLTSCIGRSAEAVLYYNEGLCRGGTFLLCSDGLYKRMDGDFLQAELSRLSPRTIRKTMERLSEYVIGRGETDNISVALMMSKK